LTPDGTWNPGFYPYYTVAAASGWGAGNLYVYRTRDLDEKDRRGELSKFKTVQHALADRERIEKGRATRAKSKTKKK